MSHDLQEFAKLVLMIIAVILVIGYYRRWYDKWKAKQKQSQYYKIPRLEYQLLQILNDFKLRKSENEIIQRVMSDFTIVLHEKDFGPIELMLDRSTNIVKCITPSRYWEQKVEEPFNLERLAMFFTKIYFDVDFNKKDILNQKLKLTFWLN